MTKRKEARGLQVTQFSIADLSNDPANARKHSDRNIEAIVASLRRFGQQKPIVVDSSGVVRAGNGTLEAARRLGWESIYGVETDLSGSEATAYAIADNRTAELADWDEDVLAAQINGLVQDDQDLAFAAGFDETELEELLAGLEFDGDGTTGEVVEDEVPEPPADPITKLGDLWLLGDHRLLCGDSTKAEDVERLMAEDKADCIVTDPPYGIGIASNPVRQAHAKSDWDATPVDPSPMIKGMPSIVWGGNYFALPPSKGFLVWDKKQPEDFTLAMCEMAWTNVDTPAKMFRKSVVSYAKEHPTQKPVELLAWCMSFVEGSVYDPFLGSGTTLIAAEQLGRKCYGMEISPAYCDVIVKRWETLTGQVATRQETQPV